MVALVKLALAEVLTIPVLPVVYIEISIFYIDISLRVVLNKDETLIVIDTTIRI